MIAPDECVWCDGTGEIPTYASRDLSGNDPRMELIVCVDCDGAGTTIVPRYTEASIHEVESLGTRVLDLFAEVATLRGRVAADIRADMHGFNTSGFNAGLAHAARVAEGTVTDA